MSRTLDQIRSRKQAIGAAVVWAAMILAVGSTMAIGQAAQAPPLPTVQAAAPVLPEVEALRLDKAVLAYENQALRIQAAQAELKRQETELQATMRRLEQPGYTLTRDQAGAWVYTRAQPAAKSPQPEPYGRN